MEQATEEQDPDLLPERVEFKIKDSHRYHWRFVATRGERIYDNPDDPGLGHNTEWNIRAYQDINGTEVEVLRDVGTQIQDDLLPEPRDIAVAVLNRICDVTMDLLLFPTILHDGKEVKTP